MAASSCAVQAAARGLWRGSCGCRAPPSSEGVPGRGSCTGPGAAPVRQLFFCDTHPFPHCYAGAVCSLVHGVGRNALSLCPARRSTSGHDLLRRLWVGVVPPLPAWIWMMWRVRERCPTPPFFSTRPRTLPAHCARLWFTATVTVSYPALVAALESTCPAGPIPGLAVPSTPPSVTHQGEPAKSPQADPCRAATAALAEGRRLLAVRSLFVVAPLLSAVTANRQPLAAERSLSVSARVFVAAPRGPLWPTTPLQSVAAILSLTFLSVWPVVRAFRFGPLAGWTSAQCSPCGGRALPCCCPFLARRSCGPCRRCGCCFSPLRWLWPGRGR